jgi:hypothetical protein
VLVGAEGLAGNHGHVRIGEQPLGELERVVDSVRPITTPRFGYA